MPSDTSILYRFADFELDCDRFELRERGEAKHIEPQVFALLGLLASNAGRLVSKDEIVEKIWDGRSISDAAIASRVKAARQALGDDGKQQQFIRTVHGRGFRFEEKVTLGHALKPVASAAAIPADFSAPSDDRPSIAVLPFHWIGNVGPFAFVGDALADELIADLSRLRWLLVIARASTFRLRERHVDCEAIGAILKVSYCLTGTLEHAGNHLILSVSLSRTADGGVIWAERFTAGQDEMQELRREILTAITANLETRIVQNEIELARRKPVTALDAWSSYHLGLDHMFRFNRGDNAKAAALFDKALTRDPDFSRALSGLSFTCFQDRFLGYSERREEMGAQARILAERALQCDPLDPFAHLNLARSMWFEDALPESIERLTACIALSPNYAQAIYSKSWAEMTQCDVGNSDANAIAALRLSPLDPLRYAMLAVQSVSALMAGDYERAADLGERAARSPGAHQHIAVIAALGNSAAGRADRAEYWKDQARLFNPAVSKHSFFASFPFAEAPGRETIERNLSRLRL